MLGNGRSDFWTVAEVVGVVAVAGVVWGGGGACGAAAGDVAGGATGSVGVSVGTSRNSTVGGGSSGDWLDDSCACDDSCAWANPGAPRVAPRTHVVVSDVHSLPFTRTTHLTTATPRQMGARAVPLRHEIAPEFPAARGRPALRPAAGRFRRRALPQRTRVVVYRGMVPPSLRAWFIVHFWADILAAVPLFVAPEWVLGRLGWPHVDPVATRMVASALFGIGIESLLCRNAGPDVFRAMLGLKVIWSASAVIGTCINLATGGPAAAWGVLVIFLVFNIVWVHYWRRMRAA